MINNVTTGLAFIAGLASFLSPCVFSLVPAYISYLGGRAAGGESAGENRWLTFTHGLAFVLGFTLVFITLGLGSSALGVFFANLIPYLARIGGAVVIIFGIHMTGLIRIPFLEYDLRVHSTVNRRWGYFSSVLMGVFFSAGWSPCIGPILGLILTLSYTQASVLSGVGLLAAYSAGLAIPFLIAATQIALVTKILRRYGRVTRYIEIGMGILMIIIGGLLLVYGGFGQLALLGADFFTSLNEVAVGRIMLLMLAASMLLGLIPAGIARSRGRSFLDWWFAGIGISLLLLLVLLFVAHGLGLPVLDAVWAVE